jgi:hypothetical protein
MSQLCGIWARSLARHLSKLHNTGDGQPGSNQEASQEAAAAAALASETRRQHRVSKQRPAAAPRTSQSAASVVPAINGQGYEAEAALAALLFAAHPVHTEAVAGIVGHAELLCAVFFIAALLTHMRAVSDTNADGTSAQWRLVAAASALVLLAAFAKEIGITVVRSSQCRYVLLSSCTLGDICKQTLQVMVTTLTWRRLCQCFYMMPCWFPPAYPRVGT